MKRGLSAFVVLALATATAKAADDAKLKQLVKEKGQETSNALVKGDYAKVVDLTFPRVVQLGGGREKMIALLKKGVQDMKSRGITFRSAKVETPNQIAKAGRSLIAIVPFTLEMRIPQGKATQKSFLLGISDDDGKSWTFIDGSKLTQENVKMFVPDFPKTVKLPEKQKPVIEKDE
jgi:hypothetical protein